MRHFFFKSHDPNVQLSRQQTWQYMYCWKNFLNSEIRSCIFTTPTQSQKNSADEVDLALSRNLSCTEKAVFHCTEQSLNKGIPYKYILNAGWDHPSMIMKSEKAIHNTFLLSKCHIDNSFLTQTCVCVCVFVCARARTRVCLKGEEFSSLEKVIIVYLQKNERNHSYYKLCIHFL